MRGVTLLVGIALTVGLCVTSAASATVAIEDATDTLGEEAQASGDPLNLLLPSPVRGGASSALSAALPGDDAPLTPDETILNQAVDVPRLSHTASTTFDPAPSTGDTTTSEAPAEASGEIRAAAPAPADAPDLPDYVDGESSSASEGDDASASTQSQASSSADPGSSVAEAWNSMDDGEKAAATAGALGLLVFGPLTLYSRIKRDDALENDTRREVYEIVEDNPGVCIQEVADQADVSYSTASYHLKRLVKMDYVTRREDGNKVLYYKNGGTFTAEERDLIPVLQNEEAMRVFRHIVENPWCYRAQVAEALDVSHTTVNWHLDRLQDADLVEEHREGRSCHLNVNDEALDRVTSTMDKLEDEAGTQPVQRPQAAPA